MSADPFLLKTAPDTSEARVTVKAPLVHRCPHIEEVDAGEVEITWGCGELTVELHSLAAYLASWHDQVISHEEITERIRLDLEAVDGLEPVRVVTRWRTAGMAVEVVAE